MRTISALIALAAASIVVVGGVGCTSGGYMHMPSLQALSRQTESLEPMNFDVTGPVQVDVESFNGNVTIVGDADATVATVEFTLDARHGFMRDDEAEQSLTQIHTSAEMTNTETGPVIHVRTSTEHDQPYQQRAHVKITAPEVSDVFIRTSHGDVTIEQAMGSIDIQSSGGDVLVMTDHPITSHVMIVNKDGDIDYRVPAESTAMFDAKTVRGRVLQRVRMGKLIVSKESGMDSLVATLNNGQNPVALRTVDGNIRIAVVSEPAKVGAMVVDP